jgi:phenylpropionate dioxygenase-like ring-hydroxylating dioxygenase large terminal subunit
MNNSRIQQRDVVRTLDPAYYTSDAIYQQECAGLFIRTWQYVGHVSQARNPGDYFSFEIGDQRLFCIRNSDNVLLTFYNVCQHRAHQLVEGQGHCKKAIVCPYHAWSYGLDGNLLRGPNTEVIPTEIRERICLTPVRTQEFCGFVFVNLNDEAEPMETWFPQVEAQLRTFVPDIDQLKPVETILVNEKCNWKASVENYSECYHCRINHRTFATGVIKPDTYDIQPQGYCLRHTTECQNLEKMTYPIDLAANTHAGDYSSWYLWPTFSFQVYPGNVLNTYHWQNVSVDEVVVTRGWYTAGGVASDVIHELALQDRQTTMEEDIHLVESQQRGFGSRGYKPGPLVIDPGGGVNSEHSIKALQQWMREAIEQ